MFNDIIKALAFGSAPKNMPDMEQLTTDINVKVVGVGGAGGNAVSRMVRTGLTQVDTLVLNTDIQALDTMPHILSYALGPETVKGMGSGGRPEVGRKAVRESQADIAELLDGSDMVFVTAGMGGGTGTGASATVADIARKKGALTVGVVTLPFSFEGTRRREVAEQGIRSLRQKVDTLIIVENDRLLPSLKGNVTLERAFEAADDVLRQGIKGISDIVTVSGMINVDFADVRSVMANGGPAFMAYGEGKGKWAAIEAARSALANPLFNAPLKGATGILLNVTGGKDLTLGQVHEVAEIIRKAAKSDANVIFGVVQEKQMKRRVGITLIGTGVGSKPQEETIPKDESKSAVTLSDAELNRLINAPSSNAHLQADLTQTTRLL
ncbi:MAG: cell division protein FtsZ [Chloroflexota bacterium]|nr:cell division protein FtsZ [Chloroflexota bacterium]